MNGRFGASEPDGRSWTPDIEKRWRPGPRVRRRQGTGLTWSLRMSSVITRPRLDKPLPPLNISFLIGNFLSGGFYFSSLAIFTMLLFCSFANAAWNAARNAARSRILPCILRHVKIPSLKQQIEYRRMFFFFRYQELAFLAFSMISSCSVLLC